MPLISIHPGTPEWKAWLSYHRGTKVELSMALCVRETRPFLVRTRMPPDMPELSSDRLSPAKLGTTSAAVSDTNKGRARSVDDIADRLERNAARNAEDATAEQRRRKADKKRASLADDGFTAVTNGRKPNLDGHDQLGVVQATDPDEARIVAEKGHGASPLRAKVITLRDDPVGQMHKRGQLDGDTAGVADVRLKAARHLQALYEIVEIGGVRAIDPSNPAVSNGRVNEPDIDRRRDAARTLALVDGRLGVVGADLLRLVLWCKCNLLQVAALEGIGKAKEIKSLSFRFRECLDTAAETLGYQRDTSVHRGRRRDSFDAQAQHTDNPKLHYAVHRAKAEG